MREARLLIDPEGNRFKEVVAERTEELLHHIARNAEKKGMKINEKKTCLMSVSAASSFDSRIRVNVNGVTIHGMPSMKILGVQIDADCSFKTHIDSLKSKMRAKTWALSKLRRAGLGQDS